MRNSSLITTPRPPADVCTLSSKIHDNILSIDKNSNKNVMKHDQVGNSANSYSDIKTHT